MEEKQLALGKIMAFFPKDYSEETISLIRQRVSENVGALMVDYNNAFCKDNDLCPICITGGWNCDSDHK